MIRPVEAAVIDHRQRPVALPAALDAARTAVLRVVCAIGLTNAGFMLLLTLAGHRTPFALAAATAWVVVWWLLRHRAGWLAPRLGHRPGLFVIAAAAGVAPIALDGGLEGTLATQAIWLTWVAAVTLGPRATLSVGGAMTITAVAGLLGAGMTVDELLHSADRFQATLLIFTPLVLALVGLVMVGTFRRVLEGAADTLSDIRGGGPACTPALTRLLHGQAPRLLEAAAPEPLTESEQVVVAMLGDGLTPKQIAWQRGKAVSTVRTQIKHAKRKTGARTLNELVRLACPST